MGALFTPFYKQHSICEATLPNFGEERNVGSKRFTMYLQNPTVFCLKQSAPTTRTYHSLWMLAYQKKVEVIRKIRNELVDF